MIFIAHRRNTLDKLIQTDTKYGVEVDIRSYKNDLVIHHDPFQPGENFEKWLGFFKHKTLILNIKEEGLEQRILNLMKKYNIEDFFFLDQSFPFLVKWAKAGEKRSAVRVSEFESIKTALSLSERISWVWLDCFNKFPINKKEFHKLKKADFKICLVSPELQGREPNEEISLFSDIIQKDKLLIDAICTKRIDLWEANLNL